MTKVKTRLGLMALFAMVSVSVFTWVAMSHDSTLNAEDATLARTGPQPVEKDMHEFMEYVFEPSYKRLRAHIAAEPADKSVWKAIKSDSLILAESSNLLWFRQPNENATEWNRLAIAVRRVGGHLYQAARKQNYDATRQNYIKMLEQCNSCHNQFAGGEHQLQP